MELKNYYTPLEEVYFTKKIHHKDSILSVGSCFSTEIGTRLKHLEFNIMVNPLGTLFNPVSIFDLLESCILDKEVDEDYIVQTNGLFYHYKWHSSVYGTSKEELIHNIKNIQNNVHRKLKSCNHLILTFGTSIVHEFNSKVIANCHKQPRTRFNKRFLSLQELNFSFEHFSKLLFEFNPNISLITTTSPIRHTKEGLIENNRSKALLTVFNQHLELNYSHLSYFPSYEMVLDVLRDYRFYSKDLIHPNEQAVDEIWRYFYNCLINPDSYIYIKKMEKYLQMKNHKIMFPESEQGKAFSRKLELLYKEINSLK